VKRNNNVMLRLNDEELGVLTHAKPQDDELASFARRALVASLMGRDPDQLMRRAASYVVACLSAEITFEEALSLFDELVPVPGKEDADGRRD
jgi:hypothetical protein